MAASVEARIVDVGRDLSKTFKKVLAAIPGAPHRPQMLARSLGVNTVLTSRILKAAQQKDPLAVAHMIPGPEPLRRLLRCAEKKGVGKDVIKDARAAVDRFEQLIDAEAGDRSALDAIISGWLPDVREKVEMIAKQSVFRGMGQLLGIASEVEHSTFILYPSTDSPDSPDSPDAPDRADALGLTVSHGLRRVRSGDVVKYDSVHAATPMFSVTGERVDGMQGLLLEQFCSQPVPRLSVRHLGDKAVYTLKGEGVGVRSAVTLAHATYHPGKKRTARKASDPAERALIAVGIAMPSRLQIFDVLMHEDVYPGQEPSLDIYRTAGVFTPKEESREVDRIEVVESIQSLGKGLARFRSADSASHQEMIAYVCARRAWDTEKLRGYRCRIEYPIYSSEIVMGFEVPVRG